MGKVLTIEQQHPQYKSDRNILDKIKTEEPTDYNLAELARLKIRYQGFPGARDIQNDLNALMAKWNYTEDSLFAKTRQLHVKGGFYKKKSSHSDEEDWI